MSFCVRVHGGLMFLPTAMRPAIYWLEWIPGHLNCYRYATGKSKLHIDLILRLKAYEVLRSEMTEYLQVLRGNVPDWLQSGRY